MNQRKTAEPPPYTRTDDHYRALAVRDVEQGKHLRMKMTATDYIVWRIRNARGNRNRAGVTNRMEVS
jgi:hypothetical protein